MLDNPMHSIPRLTQADSRSFLGDLSDVVSAGVTTLIWAGDADWICNWYGVQDVVNQVTYSGQAAFRAKTLGPYNVKGKEGGQFKTEGNLSFLRVYDAGTLRPGTKNLFCTHILRTHFVLTYTDSVSTRLGHEVMYYKPELSLQAFVQTMKKGAIAST